MHYAVTGSAIMKRGCGIIMAGVLWLVLCSTAGAWAQGAADKDIREPIIAGSWYPGNPGALRELIENYLDRATYHSPLGELKAVIVPHAGYVYSGQVAAYAYRLVRQGNFQRVVMIGPSHRAAFKGVSVSMLAGYRTPLGVVPVDRPFARKLLDESDRVQWVPKAHAQEHSLEIQIPFLQTVLPDFRIVPILMGEQKYDTCLSLARSLAALIGDSKGTLILASTDLSHYHGYSEAMVLDTAFIRYVESLDPEGLSRALAAGECEACGGGPAVTTLLAAKTLGADRSDILRYANSGDVSGDRRKVVGYLSAALTRTQP